jgi:SAM-dependent methyltransferase
MGPLTYWRQAYWADEYAHRRATNPIYATQEQIVLKHARGHVLEVGVGCGRHLTNLVAAGVDAHGFDVSSTMVSEVPVELWYRVTVGEPGVLPYADGEFDQAFTCSVLVHIPPDAVQATLEEMWRVAAHTFHVEPTVGVELEWDAHGGCWVHDLPALYREADRDLRVVEVGYEIQRLYIG